MIIEKLYSSPINSHNKNNILELYNIIDNNRLLSKLIKSTLIISDIDIIKMKLIYQSLK